MTYLSNIMYLEIRKKGENPFPLLKLVLVKNIKFTFEDRFSQVCSSFYFLQFKFQP